MKHDKEINDEEAEEALQGFFTSLVKEKLEKVIKEKA